MTDNDFKLILEEAERIQDEIEAYGMAAALKYKKKLPQLSKMIVAESKRRLANA